uniref:Structural maintenance of chromosomes protein 5 n=1 Tax=Hirondellea gigas TaxID=1518452 RepID=A0A2P2I297_9CRUS
MAFIDGNVVRILMKDFLTFDDMEVHPKPHLNVIIGPNGTGKSTIMCGLALALSQKPAITGRAKEVSEYVKHGKETATIEVEIYRGQTKKSNLVVKRVITRTNTSQFYLQGEKASYKEVESSLKKLRIQLDNLCQFLPQDRVVEFAKMNNVQLLENTEKTVGGESLYEQHEAVRNSGGAVQQLRIRVQQIQTQFQAELGKNASVEAEVRNHDVRKGLETEIKELQTRRLWFLYTQQRTQHLSLKKNKEKLMAELNALKERWQPEAEQIENFQTAVDTVRNRIKIEERVVSNIGAESSGLESRWSEFEEQRQDALREYQRKEEMHRQQQQTLQDLHKQLSATKTEIEQHCSKMKQDDDSAQQRVISELTSEVQTIGTNLTGLQNTLHSTRNQHNNQLLEIKQITDQLNRMQDTNRQRMQLLQQRYGDAYRAAMWLQKNSDRFKNTVHPPICTLLNVPNPVYAQYVEDRIPRADLIAFVCRDKDDVNLLKQLMDEQNWAVNIVHSASDSVAEFKPSRSVQDVRRLGFEMYLLDAVEGPGAVLNYLCKTYALHNIPVATKDTVNVQRVPSNFPRFYIGDSRYHHSRSRYTSDIMTNLSFVQKPMLLTVTEQTQRLTALQQQHSQLSQHASETEKSCQQLHNKEGELLILLEEKRKLKQQMLQQRNLRKTLQSRLEQKEAQIVRAEKDAVDIDEADKVKEHKMKAATRSSMDVIKGWSELAQRQSSVKHNLTALRSKFKCLGDTITELTTAMQEMEQRVTEKREEVAEAVQQVKETVRAGQETLAELLLSLGLSSASQINDAVRGTFNDGVQGLEPTEQKLTELEAHRDCLVTADAQVVEEFNRRKKHIENLQLQLDRVKEEEERCTSSMAEQRAEWLKNVATLTSTINQSFSKLMARMKCAGEVKLSKPENEDELSKYGLSICVRFRGSERLRELTAQQQSGGERAVSTALYLLALQTLSAVPFRCADEINQGMDAENERQMFTMLVEHMTDINASQYFLITPKLLPNLPYNDRVNFICVFNGPKISCQISLKDVFKRKAQLAKAAKAR